MRTAFLLLFLFLQSVHIQAQKVVFQTWNTRTACAWVDPVSGWNAQLMFKKVHRNQERVLQEVRIGAREKEAEIVRPLGHSTDGRYTELEMDWEGESLKIESAQDANMLAVRVIRLKPQSLPLRLLFSFQTIWNREGNSIKKGNRIIGGDWEVGSTGKLDVDFCLPATGPTLIIKAGDTTFFRVSKKNIPLKFGFNDLIEREKKRYYQEFNLKDDKELARFAVQTCMAWNTIFDPTKNRILHTVNRIWNVNRGGYVIFCWDNFFGSLLSYYGLKDTSMAFSNFRAVLEDATPEGFPSNNSQGNGRIAYDRSQPPVGGLVALLLYKQTKDKAFIRSVFPALYTWNRWWLKNRMNGKLLSWGSDAPLESIACNPEMGLTTVKYKNPFDDPAFHTLLGAKLESGLDDSPMYDSTLLVSKTMNLHDVGLNALFLSDCESLSELSLILGKDGLKQKAELDKSFEFLKTEFQTLYIQRDGLFLNQYTPSHIPSRIYSPTLLYPLLTSAPTKKQVQSMIDSLLLHPQRLGGEPGLPSISRNHPDYGKQRYWKGSVWPPLNYLVFRGLVKQGQMKEAKNLAESSFRLFINEYKRAKVICENYSGMNGRCDDPLVNSEPYYFWGGLLPMMLAELESSSTGKP